MTASGALNDALLERHPRMDRQMDGSPVGIVNFSQHGGKALRVVINKCLIEQGRATRSQFLFVPFTQVFHHAQQQGIITAYFRLEVVLADGRAAVGHHFQRALRVMKAFQSAFL